jgi:hypothetical protein
VQIAKRGVYRGVTQEPFNGIQIRSLVEEVGGKGVTEGMNTAAFGYAGFFLAR